MYNHFQTHPQSVFFARPLFTDAENKENMERSQHMLGERPSGLLRASKRSISAIGKAQVGISQTSVMAPSPVLGTW